MKIGMIICRETPEVMWNAFRLANMMLEGMDDVTIFLDEPVKTQNDLSCCKC